ncbi:hypothetical protein BE20_35340 [Sorangium cellulosum]|nr:hypothetical protein BE20_35340 [Sorangium cellulosum]
MPEKSSNSTTPSENRSERLSAEPPRACSGAMYVVTRRRAPTAVVITRSDDLASPKSAIFTSPWNPTSTLPGVRSRCTRLSSSPLGARSSCAAPSPRQSVAPM